MNKYQSVAVYPVYTKKPPQALEQINADAGDNTNNTEASAETSSALTGIAETGSAETIATLLRHPGLRQGSHCPQPTTRSLATGYTALDEALHLGGWPLAGCTELLASTGSGELQLLAPALQQLATQGRIALLNPPYPVCAAGFDYLGIPSQQLLIVHSNNGKDGLWACEQLLASGHFPAVMGWLEPQDRNTRQYKRRHSYPPISYAKLRKLQLCAQSQASCLLLFRPAALSNQASPASLRISLQASSTQLQLQILKQPGGWGGQQLVLPRPDKLIGITPTAHQLPVPASNAKHALQARRKVALELTRNTVDLQAEQLHKATPNSTPDGTTRLQ